MHFFEIFGSIWGLPGRQLQHFYDFLSMSKKVRFLNALERPGGTGRRPQNSLRERLGPCAEVTSRRLRQAKAWRGVSTGFAPAAGPPADLLACFLACQSDCFDTQA